MCGFIDFWRKQIIFTEPEGRGEYNFFSRVVQNLEKVEFVSMDAQNVHKVCMLWNQLTFVFLSVLKRFGPLQKFAPPHTLQSTSKTCPSLLSSPLLRLCKCTTFISQEPGTIIARKAQTSIIYYYAKLVVNLIGVLMNFMLTWPHDSSIYRIFLCEFSILDITLRSFFVGWRF